MEHVDISAVGVINELLCSWTAGNLCRLLEGNPQLLQLGNGARYRWKERSYSRSRLKPKRGQTSTSSGCIQAQPHTRGKRGQERLFCPLGRPGLRKVFSSPKFATVRPTHFSEPYGLLLWMAFRIFSISSPGCDWLSHCR